MKFKLMDAFIDFIKEILTMKNNKDFPKGVATGQPLFIYVRKSNISFKIYQTYVGNI